MIIKKKLKKLHFLRLIILLRKVLIPNNYEILLEKGMNYFVNSSIKLKSLIKIKFY
jgi:hypothetical protein